MNSLVEFILEKQIIGPNVLLDSIIEQTAQGKTSVQLMRESHLLDDQKLLSVIVHQSKNNSTFQASCKSLGLWTPDIEKLILNEQLKQTPGLIHILTKKGLNYTDLINAVEVHQK